MNALVLNTLGRGFDLEDVDIAAPIGREVLVHVQASGLCHTDLLFATRPFVPTPAVLGHGPVRRLQALRRWPRIRYIRDRGVSRAEGNPRMTALPGGIGGKTAA